MHRDKGTKSDFARKMRWNSHCEANNWIVNRFCINCLASRWLSALPFGKYNCERRRQRRRRRGHFDCGDCCPNLLRTADRQCSIDRCTHALPPSDALRAIQSVPTNIACHINWNYNFNLTEKQLEKTHSQNSCSFRWAFAAAHVPNRERQRKATSVRKLNDSKPKWKERKNSIYFEKFAFVYAGNRCKFVVRVCRTRVHSANAFDVRRTLLLTYLTTFMQMQHSIWIN